MTEAQCRCDWQVVSETERSTMLFCHLCNTYRFERKPVLPPGEMYYLQEVTPREEEDNDGPR